MLIVLLATLAAYAYTMPQTVVLEDDGEFIMAAYFFGVAHPPGYPLFALLSHPFTWLPVGSVALRVHLASGFYGAATCAVVWLVIRTLIANKGAAYAGALALGYSQAFWSQAIIADVYTLNTLLFFSSFAACLLYLNTRRVLVLHFIVLFYAMSLSNHWPLMVLATPCLLAALWPAVPDILRQLPKFLPTLLLAFAVGLSPYLWMVLRSQSHPDLAFYGAIESWSDAWNYFNRRGYLHVDSSPTAGLWDKVQLSGFLLREFLVQFTPLGALLAAAGLVIQWRYWRPSLSIGLVAGFLTGTLGLVLLLDRDYELITRATLKVYPLIPYGIMAIWLALGFDRALGVIRSWLKDGRRILDYPAAAMLGVVVVLANGPVNYRRDYGFARDYGESLLRSFKANATVLTHGDANSNVLGYLHYVENHRPDLKVLNDDGLTILGGTLFNPEDVTYSQRNSIIKEYIQNTAEPVYSFASLDDFGDIHFGFYLETDESSENMRVFRVDDRLLELFRRMEQYDAQGDLWTIAIRDNQIGAMATVLTVIVHLDPDQATAERYSEDLERASDHYSGLLKRIEILQINGGASGDQLLKWVEKAEGLIDPTVSKKDRAALFLNKGRIFTKLSRTEEAIGAYQESLEIYPHPNNKARDELLRALQ